MQVSQVSGSFSDNSVCRSCEWSVPKNDHAVNAALVLSENPTKSATSSTKSRGNALELITQLSFDAASVDRDCAVLQALYDVVIMSDSLIFEGVEIHRLIMGLAVVDLPQSTLTRTLQLILVFMQQYEVAAVTFLRLGLLEMIRRIIGMDSESTEVCVDCLFEISSQDGAERGFYRQQSVNLIGYTLLMSNDMFVIEKALSALAFLNATDGEVSEYIAGSIVPTVLVNFLHHSNEDVSRMTLSILASLCSQFSTASDQVIASGAYRHLDRFLCDMDRKHQMCASKLLYVILSRTIERKICL